MKLGSYYDFTLRRSARLPRWCKNVFIEGVGRISRILTKSVSIIQDLLFFMKARKVSARPWKPTLAAGEC